VPVFYQQKNIPALQLAIIALRKQSQVKFLTAATASSFITIKIYFNGTKFL